MVQAPGSFSVADPVIGIAKQVDEKIAKSNFMFLNLDFIACLSDFLIAQPDRSKLVGLVFNSSDELVDRVRQIFPGVFELILQLLPFLRARFL